METRGGRVHHAYGRCAPYIRNSRTIHAVPMHHHPRFCCSLGAAYALYNSRISNTHNTAAVLKLEDLEKRIQLSNGNRSIMCTLIEEIQLSGTDSCMQEVI